MISVYRLSSYNGMLVYIVRSCFTDSCILHHQNKTADTNVTGIYFIKVIRLN